VSQDNKFKHKKLFLLGSGPSLLDLTEGQKKTISNHASLAMNRYIVFWEKIGIWPSYVCLGDSGSDKTYLAIMETLSLNKRKSHLFLEEYYKKFDPGKNIYCSNITFFKKDYHRPWLNWSNSLDQEMFFYRGSLTSVLNLIAVERLSQHICLLGIDLDRQGYFWTDEESSSKELYFSIEKEEKKLGCHATFKSVTPGCIVDHWDIITQNYSRLGIDLTCSNKNSALVKLGLVKYEVI
jgi:hypothetical protein